MERANDADSVKVSHFLVRPPLPQVGPSDRAESQGHFETREPCAIVAAKMPVTYWAQKGQDRLCYPASSNTA